MTRDVFRATVEERLASMGFKRQTWRWLPGASGLVMIVDGALKDLPIRCNMKRTEFERNMGRAEGWAEILGLGAA